MPDVLDDRKARREDALAALCRLQHDLPLDREDWRALDRLDAGVVREATRARAQREIDRVRGAFVAGFQAGRGAA